MTPSLQHTIETAFERRMDLSAAEIDDSVRPAVNAVIAALETGELRVAEPTEAGWIVQKLISGFPQ